MLMPFRRWGDFSGRSRRKEYWMFTLFNLIVITVAAVTVGLYFQALFATGGTSNIFVFGPIYVAALIYFLILLIPSIAVQVRRFHDQDKSGWMVLLNFVPYIGGLIVLVFMCLEGTRGPNRFGEDPKELPDYS